MAERPKFVVMDEQIANDPAMQATKIQAAGPMAKLLEWDKSSAATQEGVSQALDSGTGEASLPGMRAPKRRAAYAPGPLQVCRGKITVTRSRAFHFQVPPNIGSPRLSGQFEARAGGTPQALNVLLLDRQQYATFVGGGPESDAVHDSEASVETIDLVLSPTLDAERDYYLIFRNLSGKPVSVEASFQVTFQ